MLPHAAYHSCCAFRRRDVCCLLLHCITRVTTWPWWFCRVCVASPALAEMLHLYGPLALNFLSCSCLPPPSALLVLPRFCSSSRCLEHSRRSSASSPTSVHPSGSVVLSMRTQAFIRSPSRHPTRRLPSRRLPSDLLGRLCGSQRALAPATTLGGRRDVSVASAAASRPHGLCQAGAPT